MKLDRDLQRRYTRMAALAGTRQLLVRRDHYNP